MFVNNDIFAETSSSNQRLAYFREWLKKIRPYVHVTEKQFRAHERKGFICPSNESEHTHKATIEMKRVRKKLMKALSVKKSRQATVQTAVQNHTVHLQKVNDHLKQHNECHVKKIKLMKFIIVNMMIQLSSVTMASAETSIRSNFVFTKKSPHPIPYNEEMHNAYQSAYPCGFYKVLDILDSFAAKHSRICNATWPQTDLLHDKSQVKAFNDEYIMLSSPMTYEAGTRACNALGTGLAEVKNAKQKQDFIDIMLTNSKTMTFAGITVSRYQNALIYQSNGIAINTDDPKNELFTLDNEPILWNDFMSSKWKIRITPKHGRRYPDLKDYMFQYTVLPENIQITKETPKSLLLTPIHDFNIHRDVPMTIVCNKPKTNSTYHDDLTRFRSNCQQTQIDLKLMSGNTRMTLHQLLPGHHEELHRFQSTNNDFYDLLRTQNGFQKKETMAETCKKVQHQGYHLFLSSPPQIVDFDGFFRTRRSTTSATKLAPIFSIMNFALDKVARPILRYATSKKPTNLDFSKHIQAHSSQKSSTSPFNDMFSRGLADEFRRSSNSTRLMLEEQQIRLNAMHLVLMVEMAAGNLENIIHSRKRLPLSRLWNDKVYQHVRSQLEQRQIKLDHSMLTATFSITRTADSFEIEYYLPYQEQKRKAHIYQIQTLPLIYNTTRYDTNPHSDYMAVDWEKDHFMPMTQEEFDNCFATTCIISSSLRHKSNTNYCGLDAYFHLATAPYSNPACQYQIKDHERPYDFLSKGNITYYSAAPNTTIQMKCRRNDDVQTKVQHIHGLGYLVMPNHCDATVDKLLIKQAKTNRPDEIRETQNMDIVSIIAPPEKVIQSYLEQQDDGKDHIVAIKVRTNTNFTISLTALGLSILAIILFIAYLIIKRCKENRRKYKLPKSTNDAIQAELIPDSSADRQVMIDKTRTTIEQNKQTTSTGDMTKTSTQVSERVQLVNYT